MVLSKLSAKGQVTLPKQVRKAIHAEPGDTVGYEITPDGKVSLKKVDPLDVEFHRALSATLEEWNSTADDKAFRGL